MKKLEFRKLTPYTPEYNGQAERLNKTLEKMRSLLLATGLPHSLWAEALDTVNFLKKRIPSKQNNGQGLKLFLNKNFDYSRLRTWGCKAVGLIH